MNRLARRLVSLAGAAATLRFGVACKSQADVAPAASVEVADASSPPAPTLKLRLVEAKDGAVEVVVRDTLAQAHTEGRTVVVYVGATWCEPCQYFHHAAERGELDSVFPRTTLLEFDLDRDRERLVAAGYVSKYIPLFALPGPDGAASGKQIEGGIKGDGGVGYIVGRLTEMLSE